MTSNIWGTKFKMHGLAKNVPANLGQVTYKTSLLHLQPRQMTLMITELRDDYPVGPDPTFNPNIFSEDEEEVFHSIDSNNSPSHTNNNIRRKLTLNERMINTNNIMNQNEPYGSINNNPNGPTLARAESYDEFPYIDNNDSLSNVSESVYSTPVRHGTQAAERRVSNTNLPSRHAISPLRCEGSVPTLQSPKNAVAPTDIIFERPSPQTVSCGGRGDFCGGGRAEYTVRSDNSGLKGNLTSVEQQPFSLNLGIEASRHITIKKCDGHVTDNCLSKLRKNICSRGDSAYDVNTRIIKSLCNRNYEHEVHPDALGRRSDGSKGLQRGDDLRYIDEETPGDSSGTAREPRVCRTTTVVPISPVCATVPVYETMIRSCSVGYLDLVDPLHAHVSLAALRGEPPRRLVLVNTRRRGRMRRAQRTVDTRPSDSLKTTSLRRCGKSRSLDSNEMPLATDRFRKSTRPDSRIESSMSGHPPNTCGEDTSADESAGRTTREVQVCAVCRSDSVIEHRDITGTYVCVGCTNRSSYSTVSQPTVSSPVPAPRVSATDSDSDYSKYYS